MRALLFAVLCIFTIGYIEADDCIIIGERQESDYAFNNRTIVKPKIPWKPMRATVGVSPPSLEEIVTHVKITNIGDKIATCQIMESSDPDESKIKVMVEGKVGEGLNVRVEAYAIKLETTTEAPMTTTTKRPITTERPTMPPTTTTKRPVPTTIEPSTTEGPTMSPTTQRPVPTIIESTTTTEDVTGTTYSD